MSDTQPVPPQPVPPQPVPPQPVPPQPVSPPVSEDRVVPQVPLAQPAPVATAAPVMQAVASLPPTQPVSSARTKEAGVASAEVTPYVEVVGSDALEQEPIPAEVEKWMEKVSHGETQAGAAKDIVIAAPPVTPSPVQPTHPVIVLPLGEQDIATGSKAGVSQSIRWLATWCKRIMKKFGAQVAFRQA